MYSFKKLNRLKRLHALIQSKATGTPNQLARKLGVSLATVSRDIEWLRLTGAPVQYDRCRQTYFYEETYCLFFS